MSTETSSDNPLFQPPRRLGAATPGDLFAFTGRPACRSWLLLLFVLVCSAVVALDRYIVADSVALCMEGNLYNCKELAQIRETQNAQVCVGYGLRIAEALTDELKAEKQVTALSAKLLGRLAQENRELSDCQRIINSYNDKLVTLLNEKGIPLPEPDAESTILGPVPGPQVTPPAPPKDRST